MRALKRPAVHAMRAVVLLLPLLSWASSQLVSEPAPHLTPPQQPQPLIRLPRNDSSASASSHEPRQQEARALSWATPAVSLRDCNPCDSMPWVPMARSLQMPQYALSIPAIQLTLPVNYGIPMAPISSPLKEHTAQQSQSYGPPPTQQRPAQQYAVPSQVYHNYGSPPTGPGSGDSKGNSPPQNQYYPPGDEEQGLPPPPLPQVFLSPTYGPPQPQTQFASSTNLNPKAASAIPQRVPPPQTHQLLPAVRFGPPFDQKLLHSNSPVNLPPSTKNTTSIYRHPPQPPPNGIRPLNQQYRDELGKRPTFLYNPIPFPAMSKTQLPPFFNYQTFNDGKQDHIRTHLQPPKPQNVVFTITETEENCRKCQEQNQQKDSEPAQAEQVTESVVKTTEQNKINLNEQSRRPTEQLKNPIENDKSSVQIVKSVPLAEYLSSVEYPMQIIQAPILDVPDLSKYFNLGYSNFPQVQNFQGNNLNFQPKTPHRYNQQIQQNSQYFTHGYPSSFGTSFGLSSTTSSLDDVKISDDQTTNSLPPNHKITTNNDLTNHQTTENTFSQSTTYHTIPTTRPSQIYHVTKSRPSPQLETSKQTTVSIPASSTLGHYVTLKPVTSGTITSTNPTPVLEPVHSSQNHHSTIAAGNVLSPSGPASLRYHDNGGVRDWTYGRGPRPFVSPTTPSHAPRFSVRPTPAAPKKAKHIHQIIVPYTTNKQTPPVVREPANTHGWTAIPPTNQGRKVPTNLIFGDQFPSTSGSDQTNNYQNVFPSAPSSPNFALTSSGPDNLKQQPIFPTNQGQPLNLPPQVINHILHLNQQGTLWPTGPEGLQQLLVTNLQGLLRGEEDSIDIARLQKNIDNWTAEGYKQSAPSVNFVPVTNVPHIFHSKKIPDYYFTSTEPTSANYSRSRFPQHNFDSDHEVAESQKHQIKVHPSSHSKDQERLEDTSESIESLLNSWSLLGTKVTLPTPPTEMTTTPEPTTSEPTSKVWEKVQVSISPLTKEKVYVVTPVSVTDPEPEENSTLLSTRVERSYSVKSAGKVIESSAPEQS